MEARRHTKASGKHTGSARRQGSSMRAASPRGALREFAQDLPGMILIVNAAGGVTFANARFTAFTGTKL
ncbi:MAG: hypothetical protein IT282_14555, partial [Bacteroidetes bacterium]|nr:hypothetical protein [Bacteroidota bacterium]